MKWEFMIIFIIPYKKVNRSGLFKLPLLLEPFLVNDVEADRKSVKYVVNILIFVIVVKISNNSFKFFINSYV